MLRPILRLACITAMVVGASGVSSLCHERVGWSQVVVAERAWLGVEFDTTRGGAKRATVTHVFRNSPAFAAGVRDNDVIIGIDDQTISRADDVIRTIAARSPGQRLRISMTRGDTTVQVLALLAPLPPSDQVLRLDKIGAPAPAWKASLTAVSGDIPKSLGELRGKVIVLDFWASWCTACRMSASRLTGWQRQYGAQGLSVIGITDDPVAEASESASSFGMKYGIASDESNATQQAYGVRALPTVFVIDKRGVIREVSVGFASGPDAAIESLLQKLLAEPTP